VRGGLVANDDAVREADIGIIGEKVGTVAPPNSLGAGRMEIAADGLWVTPGGVDPHVHIGDVVGEFSTLDDFRSGTIAAAHGGTTTVIDFAMPRRDELPSSALARRSSKIDGAVVDVAFHAGITSVSPDVLADIPGVVAAGSPSFKLFTVYDDVGVSVDDIRSAARVIGANGGIALIHAEDPVAIAKETDALLLGGHLDARFHPASRPPKTELTAVQEIARALAAVDGPAYLVHLSTPEAVLSLAEVQRQGHAVWGETCPHYVLLDDAVYEGAAPERFVCSPPIRDQTRAAQLRRLVESGQIAVWASDHCCYDTEQKARHAHDFRRVPNGLPGIETRLPLLMLEVIEGRLPLEQFVAMTASNPARLNGLYPRKGRIGPGADADLALWNRRVTPHLSSTGLHMSTDFTPFEGRACAAPPQTVMLRGRVVIDGGQLVGADRGIHLLAGSLTSVVI